MERSACCFTGHRFLLADTLEKMMVVLDREIESLIAQGVTDFISGGALGFDQAAASLVVAKREMGKKIRLIFALPCENQDESWSESQKTLYRQLLREADERIYVSERYDRACMRRRNQFMVDHSAYCICALLWDKSGTGQTVRYARKRGLLIINILE